MAWAILILLASFLLGTAKWIGIEDIDYVAYPIRLLGLLMWSIGIIFIIRNRWI